MRSSLFQLVAALGCAGLTAAQADDAARVQWVGDAPSLNLGTTFGLPWPRGKYPAESTSFTATTSDGQQVDVQSWITAYWPDNSIKWTGHAVGASSNVTSHYTVNPVAAGNSRIGHKKRQDTHSLVSETGDEIVVNTGKITATFKKSGNVLLGSIKTAAGKTMGTNGALVLLSQSSIAEDDAAGEQPSKTQLNSVIEEVTVGNDSSIRALVTVKGKHEPAGGGGDSWMPFAVRFYLYKNSEAIKVVHTLIYDETATKSFIAGIGVRFDVPLSDELYNRHVRISSAEGGLLNEAVKGITGLRRDPGQAVRTAQYNGEATPDISTWDTRVSSRMHWIPSWGDYSLTQLSADGFNLHKRTKAGQSWVKIPSGTKAGGLVYLGGAIAGGLAVGLRDLWKRYPTGIDIRNAASDVGQITLWLYSPAAGPMDLRPYHDGMGEDTYAKQLDALEITYEDWEDGYDTPYGVARTNELFIYAFDKTPSQDHLSALNTYTNEPPVLYADPLRVQESRALGSYWGVPSSNTTEASSTIESHLDFLVNFYQTEIRQRRFYGYWDHGDFMHTYDVDRHTWRYDIGGYAWDNSELSPDLFFWNYFLRTGRADVYRLAEAQVRHGGEVDVYHLGNFTGLGTRHGVNHWSDSAKQIRISTTIYRRIFYYISGGDERTGDLVSEVQQAESAFVKVDARRKIRDPSVVYVPDPEKLYISLGLDWVALAGAWLMEWERRGPRGAGNVPGKLLAGLEGITKLKNAFVTGEAMYNSSSGVISPPPTDLNNTGIVNVLHLDAVFGLQEILTQIFDHVGEEKTGDTELPKLPDGIVDKWLEYCYFYAAPKAEQAARYGKDFGSLSLYQGHSRLTAYAAWKTGNETLARRAWKEFLDVDGLKRNGTSWKTEKVGGGKVLVEVEEASWISTNDAALYGLNAMENLFFVGGILEEVAGTA